TILLNSHHDTVKPASGWQRDPFHPGLEGDTLYGLGSNDAGGPLVSLIATFLYFYDQKELPFNLLIAATAEEEISGKNGIAALLPDLGAISLGIVGEPTKMIDVRTNEHYSNQEVFAYLQSQVQSELKARSFRLNSSGIPLDHPLIQHGLSLDWPYFGSPTLSDQALMSFPTLKLG
ncbi:UNVERIFIED_CONTAM: hypothetical protein GTU68_040057, partial [Idotea baltica]|nr:hypothetical protein [Idotea baltica]